MSSAAPGDTDPDITSVAAAAQGPTLHSLPPEVIERALISSDPRDVARYAQTCRFARDLVYEPKDAFLWRELFLGRPFDDLRRAASAPPRPYNPVRKRERAIAEGEGGGSPAISSGPCFRSELQRRVRAEAIAAASDRTGADELYRAFETFLNAIATALPVAEEETSASTGVESDPNPNLKPGITSRSENIRWLDRILSDTNFKVLDRTITSSHSATNPPLPSPFVSINPGRRELRPMRDIGTFLEVDNVAVEAHQLRHKLRAYAGLSYEEFSDGERIDALRNASRCFVYDMRKYDGRKLWGPYRAVDTDEPVALPEPAPVPMVDSDSESESYEGEEGGGGIDEVEALWGVGWAVTAPERSTSGLTARGRRRRSRQTLLVNWEHVEHIVNVVRLKLRDIPHPALGFDKKPLFTLDGLRAYSAVGSFERDPRDWAGVTGKWRRFVCFMDYRDLYMFNYSHLPPGPHHPQFFEAVSIDEAMRPVELHLSLISKEEYFSNPSRIPHVLPNPLPMSDVNDPAFPTLYFDGHSRGPPSSVASIRGKVSTLADGAIRWQFVTTYDGRMQWSAEGVQLGHACSAAGVAGIWTGAHHERDDPAGPFWMVKAEDDLPDGILNTLH
ncbi:hypothetical protein C8Q79DRAFT_933753 [Trametes meyenii]|nr:hypothetical protein C8Q79DRAFT_933753 [Trametes meyenii]